MRIPAWAARLTSFTASAPSRQWPVRWLVACAFSVGVVAGMAVPSRGVAVRRLK